MPRSDIIDPAGVQEFTIHFPINICLGEDCVKNWNFDRI